MTEQSAEEIVAATLLERLPDYARRPVDFEMCRHDAALVVAALRSARLLLPEAETESCPEGHDPDGELAQHHRVVGPWVPVEEDTK